MGLIDQFVQTNPNTFQTSGVSNLWCLQAIYKGNNILYKTRTFIGIIHQERMDLKIQ